MVASYVWMVLFVVMALVPHQPHIILSEASGTDAHTIVLLRDAGLDDALYDAPSGTVLHIPVDGYDILGSAPAGGSRHLHQYPLNEVVSTPRAFTRRPRLPLRAALSSEWVVLEKPSTLGHSPTLLHCRLPHPQNISAVEDVTRAYISENRPLMQTALQDWWRRVATRRASRCLYGDGESAVTGKSRYYEVCPLEGVYRVHAHILTRTSAATVAKKKKKSASTPAKEDPILKILDRVHRSAGARAAFRRDAKNGAAFEQIGSHHETVSVPQWNHRRHVWEMRYPSTQPCREHYSHVKRAERRSDEEAISPEDPFWTTLIRLRCPSTLRERNMHKTKDDPKRWTITEVRQLCRYEVELETFTVCGWEQELDSLKVNPIPCVAID